MKVGIVGKPGSGKTCLFEAATRGHAQASHTKEPVHGVVEVPDPRFDYLVKLHNPKKITPATIDFVDDVARIGEEHGGYSDSAMAELRNMDALVLVIDAHETDAPDPELVRMEAIDFQDELGLRDLGLVENRLERVHKQLSSTSASSGLKVEAEELAVVKHALEAGKRFDQMDLGESERKTVMGFQLLTAKPLVVAVNVAEGALASCGETLKDAFAALEERHLRGFCLSAELEREIAQLEDSEQADFLADAGLEQPAAARLIREVYSSCNLITFFTMSDKEVHAWPLERASTALDAAESIHSDLARGFIRAEVIAFEDLRSSGGWDEAKAAGKLHLVGKDHTISDGDCVYIRFKV